MYNERVTVGVLHCTCRVAYLIHKAGGSATHSSVVVVYCAVQGVDVSMVALLAVALDA